MMKHYIVSRWNTFSKGEGIRNTDMTWLLERYALFCNTSLPSLYAQTNKDFTYVALLGDKTPFEFIEKITKTKLWSFDFIIATPKDFVSRVVEDIKSHDIITTRLDNDDMVCDNFVALTQAALLGKKDKTLYDPKVGLWHDTITKETIFVPDRNIITPYISLYESRGSDYVGVYAKDHGKMADVANNVIRYKGDKPKYCTITHKGNVLNHKTFVNLKRKYPCVDLSDYYKDFSALKYI